VIPSGEAEARQEVPQSRSRRSRALPTSPPASDITALSVEVVDTVAGLAALAPDYERLQSATGNTLPFALHEWHVAWWNNFPRPRGSVRDELRILVARDEKGECVAIVPLVSSRRGIGRFSVGTMALIGPDPNISEIRAPLIAPGFEARAAYAVHCKLAEDPSWDWIHWSGMGGPFAEALALAANVQWRETMPDYILDLPPTWEELRSSLKRNIRESLRHCYNSLKRDNLKFETVVASTPEEVERGVTTFLELHAMRASAENGVAHANRFESEVARSFLQEVCHRLARRDVTRVIMLRIDGKIVAARIAFLVGNGLYLYYSGFDPAWGKYSVMTTTVAEAIKHAIDLGLATVNLSPGTDVSKTRWGARVVPVEGAVQLRPTWRSHIAYEAYRRATDHATPFWASRLLQALPRRTWGARTPS
jgi:CelD/BcsL family acetyltransferase involved in cellulose biosynthesis